MADLLQLSARYVDEGVWEGPGAVNRVTTELSEVAAGIAVVEAFSHVVAFASDAGLVLFDTSLEAFGPGVLRALRGWSDAPVHTIVYTHGHVDHVGGAAAILEEARGRGARPPQVVGHEGVAARFDRYARTARWNALVNARQFGGGRLLAATPDRFGPRTWVRPDTVVRDAFALSAGGLAIELRHARGETDDHLWAWLPDRRALCAGDFVTWVFPNAGNPQKVQRYPLEWAGALRAMAALEPELLLPAHGLPIAGRARIARVLGDVAGALESLVEQTLRHMNEGARLDEVLRAVALPAELLERPYLRPVYDEPEFVVRNVWRQYGGWWDGNPAKLKPAPERALAAELAALAGGAAALCARARALGEAREWRLACELVELAAQAAPGDPAVHAVRAELYGARRREELSLMARGTYGAAARESAARAEAAGPGRPPEA
jgi:alkyl sulfatase BDS1-like metallo-beta-lactamase superfamily hydrolase